MKRLACGALLLCVFGASWMVTSLASGAAANPHFPTGYTPAALPALAPAGQDAVALNNLLGGSGPRNPIGIDASSFAMTRGVAHTTAGQMYFVPGRSGACVTLPTAVSCLSDNAPGPVLAVLTEDSATGTYVGGGVVQAGIHSVTVTSPAGGSKTYQVQAGAFSVAASDGIVAGTSPVTFTANH